MRVSELEFTTEMRENVWRGHSVEKPKEDAHRLIANEEHAQNYIDQFGDVEIVFNEEYKYWKVPAFKVGRDEYSRLKQIDCERWGCE